MKEQGEHPGGCPWVLLSEQVWLRRKQDCLNHQSLNCEPVLAAGLFILFCDGGWNLQNLWLVAEALPWMREGKWFLWVLVELLRVLLALKVTQHCSTAVCSLNLILG